MLLENYVFLLFLFYILQIELEAIAHSRLGMLYHKALKNKLRAKEYLMTATSPQKMFYTEGIHACKYGMQELLWVKSYFKVECKNFHFIAVYKDSYVIYACDLTDWKNDQDAQNQWESVQIE